MLGTVSKKLWPLSPKMIRIIDDGLFKMIIKNQRLSFSVSKVLYTHKKHSSLQAQDETKEEFRSEEESSSGTNSIIARQIYHKRFSSRTIEDDPNLFETSDDLRNKLEEFSKQLRSSHMFSNPTDQRQEDSYGMERYKTDDHSVEDLIFKDDILMQPKPSSLLGTEDPNVPASEIPCVGCGGMLQCHNRVIPGFLPSENFKLMTEKELKTSICQRCHYIQHHDTFFSVSASPESYATMISKIKDTRSLIVMVLDVMDIPGSIVPNLMDNIGHKHPILVVGNKADLLAPDSPDYLVNTRNELRKACYNAGYSNIRKVIFVSAKTGFGVERLISLLFSYYKQRVNVYIVGTANAGKSSLFNTLLASDYCKHSARDLIQRATVSVWPGTTLNLLKFPIMRPTSRAVTLRRQRLKQEEAMRKEKERLQKERKKEKKTSWELTGDVNKTDVRTDNQLKEDGKSSAWGQEIVGYKGGQAGGIRLPSSLPEPSSFDEENYLHSFWTYDTPGVINPDQVMNLLEPNELSFLSPVNMIIPRCVLLKPGTSVFASGLTRLDYVEGEEPLIATFHCSSSLPLRAVLTEEADDFYLKNVGTPELGIPLGDKSRLDKIPSLVMKEFDFVGEDSALAVADIQLSSVGWVSIAPKMGKHAKLRAFTPAGKGLSVRTPPLASNHTHFRGKRISGTPFFRTKPQGSAMIHKTIVIDKK